MKCQLKQTLLKPLPMKRLIITLKLMALCSCFLAQATAQSIALSRVDKTNAHKSNGEQAVTLESKLRDLEKQFNVSFLYNSGYVSGIKIKDSGKASSLEAYLRKILEPNNLAFRKLRENFYVIYTKEEIEDREQQKFQKEQNTSGQNESGIQQLSGRPINILAANKVVPAALTVSGVVTDAVTGEPLPGASIIIKNTSNGTTTDNTGRYSLSNVPEDGILVFSFIGYLSSELPVEGRSIIDVKLSADSKALSEVVVVGYGSVSKKDVTGAVSSVGGSEIQNMPLRTASDALQGKAAGVMVTQSSGSPGSAGVVRIRGIGSINNSNEPLYIVDGLPQSGIGWLNPNDIETMDIHKDASAAAIYGSRASNGLVIITTKREPSPNL
jgi:TonB-dependent SusC/RagA subfamily outer membrane receptor